MLKPQCGRGVREMQSAPDGIMQPKSEGSPRVELFIINSKWASNPVIQRLPF